MTRWTAQVEVRADADKIPDGPVEAAKYASDRVAGPLASSRIEVERHNDDGSSDTWLVDATTGEATSIGHVKSSPDPEERLLASEWDRKAGA